VEVNIHIGPPKTGTTTLQNFLVQNGQELKNQGYSVLGNGSNFESMQRDFALLMGGLTENSSHVKDWLIQQKKLLVIDEFLWNGFTGGHVQSLMFENPCVTAVNVSFTFRSTFSRLHSHISDALKTNDFLSLQKFVDRTLLDGWFNYENHLREFDGVANLDVSVLSLNKTADILSIYCDHVGIETPLTKSNNENVSVSPVVAVASNIKRFRELTLSREELVDRINAEFPNLNSLYALLPVATLTLIKAFIQNNQFGQLDYMRANGFMTESSLEANLGEVRFGLDFLTRAIEENHNENFLKLLRRLD
jgi:hypothetical protein